MKPESTSAWTARSSYPGGSQHGSSDQGSDGHYWVKLEQLIAWPIARQLAQPGLLSQTTAHSDSGQKRRIMGEWETMLCRASGGRGCGRHGGCAEPLASLLPLL